MQSSSMFTPQLTQHHLAIAPGRALAGLRHCPVQAEWSEDLKKVLLMAGESNQKTVFLFTDTQIKLESFVEDISNLLNTYEVC